MYLLDYHVHTKRCGHASGEDREYVEAAIEKGLKELGFADHIPRFYYPENAKVTERGMSPADLEEYVGAVQDLKAAYPEIRIKLGLEVDFVPGWEEQALKLLEPYPWDYLLGSVHFISEWNYGYIGYEKEHTPREIFTAYFDKVAAMAVSGCFDILAHIDLPRRFFPRLPEAETEELYQVLAARLGKAGVVIELNTFGIRSARQEAAPVCAHCGVVESVQAQTRKGESSGVGAVAGGVIGGLIGNQMGGGNGKKAMTVVGAVGGGLAGNEIEKQRKATTVYLTQVRMDDGSLRSFTRSSQLAVGQRVRVDGQKLLLQQD